MEFANTGKLAQQLLLQAVQLRASDVHIEPSEEDARVRVRVDGLLQDLCILPLSAYGTLLTQLKVHAGMDIAEKRLPQDGRWQLSENGLQIDLRLATLPTINGEKAVVRILDREERLLSLSGLGLSEDNNRLYRDMCRSGNGLALLTGPTGSGKTTTLYATLRQLQQGGLNLVTIEDPVEYKLPGVNQVAVNRRAGLDFAAGLRALVRQDPDIIMLGEIRDPETAAMAVQAALTGHLVLSTLHTNSAVGAIARLLDMGVASYLLAAALRGVMAQRLVRRICPHCSEEYAPSAAERVYLQRRGEGVAGLRHGAGCEYCRNTGYLGRLAVQEVLPVDENLAELISRRAPRGDLLRAGAGKGWRGLYDDGVKKALAGLTTVAELWRVGIREERDYVE